MTAVLLGLSVGVAVLLWGGTRIVPWLPAGGRARSALRGDGGETGDRGRGGRPQPGAARTSGVTLVPESLELLALGLLGGGSLGEAVRSVALALPDAYGHDLARVSAAMHQGGDTVGGWRSAGPEWEPARRCLELAAVAGLAPGPALRQAATDLRRDAIADIEVATARLGVRLVLPLGLAFLPAFVLTTVLPLVLALLQDLSW